MDQFVVLLSYSTCLLVSGASAVGGPIVRLKQGLLQGVQEPGAPGTAPYFAFRGIPFAAAPLGDLRFKAPRPAPSWTGTRNASQEGSACLQAGFTGQLSGSEDCLYLNVYTPKLACSSTLPVMVFFHTGGLIFGDGSRSWFGPDFINFKDVVLVVPNYRLGPFGFLNLGTPGAPGNAGLKDSRAALQWVRDNIEAFCGNANQVTVAGHSAGATLAHVNVLSPRSAGLFRRAFLMSGNALLAAVYQDSNVDSARELATRLGATNNSTATLEKTLREASGQAINAAHASMLMKEVTPNLMYEFTITPEIAAVSEKDLPGSVFTTTDPESMIRNRDVKAPVPILTGTTKEEGDTCIAITLQSPPINGSDAILTSRANSGIAEVLRRLVKVPAAVGGKLKVPAGPGSAQQQKVILAMVRSVYSGGNSSFTKQQFTKIIGDAEFDGPLRNYMRICHGSVSLYVTDVSTRYNFISRGLVPLPRFHSATHGDDLGYLFRPSVVDLHQNFSDTTEAGHVLRYMTTLITDFVKGRSAGRPVACGQSSLPYLLINGRSPAIRESYGSGSSSAVWEQIFDLLRKPRSETPAKHL